MSCKYCYQEIAWKTGEPLFNEDDTPSMLCDIDCLPIKGRLQRLVYANIGQETTISELVSRVQRQDPNAAQGNISRALSALSALKAKRYVFEGALNDQRVLIRATEYSGYGAEGSYGLTENPSASTLRHMLIWSLAQQQPDKNNWYSLDDNFLIELAERIFHLTLPPNTHEWWDYAYIYKLMDRTVSKLRYVVQEYVAKPLPVSEELGKDQRKDNWAKITITPLRKQKKRGQGWQAFHPYFRVEWERLESSGEVNEFALKLIFLDKRAKEETA